MTRGWQREPARHSLAARGVKTARVPYKAMGRVEGHEELWSVTIPPILYHGTPLDRLDCVLEKGLLVNQDPNTCTIEMGHEDDTWSNISLANTIGDACFFVTAANMSSGNIQGGQAILEIDMTKLPENPVGRRPLFGHARHYEFKYYSQTGIPPSAISRIFVREFNPLRERWYSPAEYSAEHPRSV